MRFWLFVYLFFSLSQPLFSQDTSETNARDSVVSRTTYERLQDSLYRQRMERSMNEKGQVLEQFLADFKERQEREKRQTYIRIGLGVTFVVILTYGLLRRRRKSRQQ